MWPRDDESRHKYVGLSGFVSYMNRRDTEAAVKELDGSFWDGNKLKVCLLISKSSKLFYVNVKLDRLGKTG